MKTSIRLFTFVSLNLCNLILVSAQAEAIEIHPDIQIQRSFTGREGATSSGLRSYAPGFLQGRYVESEINTAMEALLKTEDLKRAIKSPADRAEILAEIRREVKARWDAGGIANTNELGIKMVEVAHSIAVSRIIEKTFKSENIKTSGRDEVWAQKILANFKSCISFAKTPLEARGCSDKSKADDKVNVGLAVVYETAREEMQSDKTATGGDKYARRQSLVYQACVKDNPKLEARECAVRSMRDGISAFSREQVEAKAKALLKGSTIDVAARVMPAMEKCLTEASAKERANPDTVNLRGEFNLCADKLVRNTGKEIARESVLQDSTILAQVPEAQERTRLAEKAAGHFDACAAKTTDRVDGQLNVGACTLPVSRTVTEDVAGENLKSQITRNLQETHSEAARDEMHTKMMAELKKCLAQAADDSGTKECISGTNGLVRSATREIGTLSARGSLKTELGSDKITKAVKESEQMFDRCLKDVKETPSDCAKAHAVRMAQYIGATKLRVSIGGLIGNEGLKSNDAGLKALDIEFGKCLAKVSAGDKMTAEIKACGAELKTKGTAFARNIANKILTAGGGAGSKEAQAARARILNRLDDLSGLQPAKASDESALGALTSSGLLGERKDALNQFINYDPAKAADSVDRLAETAKAKYDSPQKKADAAVQSFNNSGFLDQIIKASAKADASKSLNATKGAQRPPESYLSQLTAKNTFEKVFGAKELSELKKLITAKFLTPSLVDGKTPTTEAAKAAEQELKMKVASMLAKSPHFGAVLAEGLIKKALDSKTGSTRFFGELFYGADAFSIDRLKRTSSGRAAIAYLQNEILLPKMLADVGGDRFPASAMALRQARLEAMVEASVKGENYQPVTRPTFSAQDVFNGRG